ncbi:hypothetical protein HDK64DRAFT_148513 [Phyllosticta capitalensis]
MVSQHMFPHSTSTQVGPPCMPLYQSAESPRHQCIEAESLPSRCCWLTNVALASMSAVADRAAATDQLCWRGRDDRVACSSPPPDFALVIQMHTNLTRISPAPELPSPQGLRTLRNRQERRQRQFRDSADEIPRPHLHPCHRLVGLSNTLLGSISVVFFTDPTGCARSFLPFRSKRGWEPAGPIVTCEPERELLSARPHPKGL